MTWVLAIQPVFLAAVLGWSGALKATGGSRVAGAALHRLLGGRLAVPAYVAVGVVELLVAAALLAVPGPAAPVAAAALAVGFLAYLGYAALATPAASCGCMGSSHAPVSWRAFARAGMLLLAGLGGAWAGGAWWSGIRPVSAGAVLIAEAALVVALSAELDRYWLLPLRRVRVRITRPLAGASDEVPLHATVTQLQLSDVYRQVAGLLISDVREYWDADEWRIVCYAARHEDQPATAVFAVPRLRDDPAAVRVSFVDDKTLVPA